MKNLISFLIIGLNLVFFSARTVQAIPIEDLNGASASVTSSQFVYNGATGQFTTVANNTVEVQFFNANGSEGAFFDDAFLNLQPIDFSGGFGAGTGGGFTIYASDMSTVLLSGTFSNSTIILDGDEAVFESSLIVDFVNPSIGLVPEFNAPGLFSATLGNVPLDGSSFTTQANATADIYSTPEPASLLLLGSGLAAIAIWGRKKVAL